jgi:hypothetical protein
MPLPVADTSIALTASVNPSLPGQSVTYTATCAISAAATGIQPMTPYSKVSAEA